MFIIYSADLCILIGVNTPKQVITFKLIIKMLTSIILLFMFLFVSYVLTTVSLFFFKNAQRLYFQLQDYMKKYTVCIMWGPHISHNTGFIFCLFCRIKLKTLPFFIFHCLNTFFLIYSLKNLIKKSSLVFISCFMCFVISMKYQQANPII